MSPSDFAPIIENYLPEIIVGRSSAYINTEESAHEGGRIIGLIAMIYKFSIYIVFLLIYKNYRIFIQQNIALNRMFLYSFYIVGVFNILSVIPSVERFLLIGQWILISTIFILFYSLNEIEGGFIVSSLNKIKPIILLFCLTVAIRFLFPIMGVGSILSNPFLINFFVEDDLVIGSIFNFF